MPIREPMGFQVPLWLVGPGWPLGHPVRLGVPLPRGALRREELVRLVDGQGRPVRLQTEVLARWPDESIQWLLVDFWAYKSGPERQTWHLQVGRVGHGASTETEEQSEEAKAPTVRDRPLGPLQPAPSPAQGSEAMSPAPGQPAGWPASAARPEANGYPRPFAGEGGLQSRPGEGEKIHLFPGERQDPPHPATFGSRPLPPEGEAVVPPHPASPSAPPASPAQGRGDGTGIRIEDQGPVLWVDTGPVQFGLDQRRLRPIGWVRINTSSTSPADPNTKPSGRAGAQSVAELQTLLQLAGGRVREATIDGWRVESAGPVRLTLRAEGRFRRAKELRVRARLSFFAGTGLVCYQLCVHNPRRARHRGGLWDLGDPGSVLLKDLSVWVRLTTPIQRAACRIEPAGPVIDLGQTLQQGGWRLYQDSSGGPNWQSLNHVNRQGRVPCRLAGYEVSLHPLPTAGEGGLQSRPGEGAFSPLSSPQERGGGEGAFPVIPEQAGIQVPLCYPHVPPHPASPSVPPASPAEGRGELGPPHPSPSPARGEAISPPHPATFGSRPLPPGERQGPPHPDPSPTQERGEMGRRALPVAAVQTNEVQVAVAAPEFWQQFPKALEVQRQAVRVGLWPAEWADLHELQGGERKTHTLWLDFTTGNAPPVNPPDSSAHSSEPIGPNPLSEPSGPEWSSLQSEPAAPLSPAPLPQRGEGKGAQPPPNKIGQEVPSEAVDRLCWVHEPIHVVLPPEVWQAAGVLEHFIPAGQEASGRLDVVLTEAIAGPESLLARRELIDEYGWRHYGDLYADHENAHYPGPKPVISHYNNQFDVIYGAILQEARTGNPAWRAVYDPLARHVMDIDLYHTQEDRPAYNGGMFWPTDHYKTAHTATHRTYSRANLPADGSPYGGGPGPEHNYATGLLYYYYLTGNRDAREAVVQLADWVLQMDDGSQTPWGILDPGPTGLASATRSPDYHGPGRGAANSIQTLLDAWQVTGQRKYLTKAEELIRRTIHPADVIADRRLLDAENRWSYTMYLSALARYLEVKIQQEELDAMYRYAQAALVHYAAWMAEQERPYLDHPEQLEYVTEAWAVQELRKANAMRQAAHHAEAPLRQRLLQRAAELADRAWQDWASFPTRMSTRALAVLLVEGVRDAYYRAQTPSSSPRIGGARHFGWPEPFVPQRERVRRLLQQPVGWIRLVWALAKPANWVRLIEKLWRHRN